MRDHASIAPWPLPGAPAMTAASPGAAEADDDLALVDAALSGQPEAFDRLVTRHRRAVYHVCYRFVRNHEDAADLTQDTFVRAWRALGSFRRQARFSTWLHRIAVNVSLNKVSVKTPGTEPLDPEALVDVGAAAPGDRLAADERARLVREAIDALPPRQRSALILRTYHELSHQEVARLVGTSVGAVKANVFHALANLRRRLGGAL